MASLMSFSRSVLAKFTPEGHEGLFFGLFEITNKRTRYLCYSLSSCTSSDFGQSNGTIAVGSGD